MSKLLDSVIASLGYCCKYAFFRASGKWSGPQIAAVLGVSTTVVKLWRRQYRQGTLVCSKRCPTVCLKKRGLL